MEGEETKVSNQRQIFILYFIIMVNYMINHLDGGILSANMHTELPTYLGDGVTTSELSLLASSLYFGNMLGCLLLPVVFAFCSAKWVNIIGSIGNGITVSIITFTSNYWVILVSRVLVGVF